MSTDLHTRLHAEVERRLAVARAATQWEVQTIHPYMDGSAQVRVAEPGKPSLLYKVLSGADAQYLRDHEPAETIRRYEGELKVLQRHAPVSRSSSVCDICSSDWHLARQPCPEVLGVAERLGIEVSDG